jgi:hypothetical protein
MRRIIHIIIITGWILLLPLVEYTYAQTEKLYRAHKLYLEKKFEQAKGAIDSASCHEETKNLSETHTVRAFIYFELYKRNEKNSVESKLRDTIIQSVYRSEKLNPDSTNHNNNMKLIYNIAINYFNLSNNIFTEQKDADLAEKLYFKYKELMKVYNSNTDFKSKDIEFYNALGSHFASEFIYLTDQKNTLDKNMSEKARIYLTKVLESDPENESANFNLGLMNYAEAVYLIKNLDAATDLSQLDVVQDNASKLAKKAEVFILRVYNKNTSNIKAVEALYYVYRALYDKEKYTEFEKKCNEMGIQVNK